MRRRLTFGVLLVACVGLTVTTSAGKPAAIKEIPVTVTVEEGAYAIQSDGHGSYADGVAGVKAVFVPTGNLALTTGSGRALFVDFSGTCSGPCDPPWGTGTVTAFMSTSACDNGGGLRDMGPGTSQRCTLGVNFGTPATGWFIRFGEYDGTTPATVERLVDGTWTIDVPVGGVARLLSYPTKGRFQLTERGDFAMPVHLTLTQP